MISESIVHCICHSRPEFELRIHLCSTFRSDCIINFGAVLWSEIFSITVFKSFTGIDCILFSQLKPSPTTIVNAMISILRVIMGKIFTIYSNFGKMTITIHFFRQLLIKIFLRINYDIFYFCFWLHYWSSLLLNLLSCTVNYFC